MARHLVLALFLIAAAVMASATPAFSQDAAAGSDPPSTELASLDRSVRELVALLHDYLDGRDEELELRRIEVAIAALDLRSRSIDRLESDLQNALQRRDNIDQRKARMERQVAEFSERLLDVDQTSKPDEHANLLRAKANLEAELERLTDETWRLDQRAIDIENRILDKRRAIEHLEDMVDEALGDL
jgi:DNA repair exonuclease SbcCD ATPase subunit